MMGTPVLIRAAPQSSARRSAAPICHQQHLTLNYLVMQSGITSLTADEIRQASLVEAMIEASSSPEPKEIAPELVEAIKMRRPSEFDNRMVLACVAGFILARRLISRHDAIVEQLMKNNNNDEALAEVTFRSEIRKRKWKAMVTTWKGAHYVR